VALVVGALSYFATASDVHLLQIRLDQKIISDQLFDTQRQIWMIEDRNRDHGIDPSQWPDNRDIERHRELKLQLYDLERKQDFLKK
jgi:hypothetical protein